MVRAADRSQPQTAARDSAGRDAPEDRGSRLTVLIALAANALLAAAKLIAGLVSGSAAMLAEAAHSIADTADQVMLLGSLRLARRPADAEHPFGHGKERFFWSFVASVWIFLMGAVFSIGEGLHSLQTGRVPGSPVAAYAVLAAGFVFEGTSFIRASRHLQSGARRSRLSMRRFVNETRDPTPRVVFIEDGAALIGLALAAAGLTASRALDQPWLDGTASILIGLLLAGAAIVVGGHARDLLLGESARPAVAEGLRGIITDHPDVESLGTFMTMHLGPDDLLVAARVRLRDGAASGRVGDEIAEHMREADPTVQHVFIHPAEQPDG
jgi:cation diffusion facilitator family transporter